MSVSSTEMITIENAILSKSDITETCRNIIIIYKIRSRSMVGIWKRIRGNNTIRIIVVHGITTDYNILLFWNGNNKPHLITIWNYGAQMYSVHVEPSATYINNMIISSGVAYERVVEEYLFSLLYLCICTALVADRWTERTTRRSASVYRTYK